MGLISALLRFVLNKLVAFLAVLLLLFLGFVVVQQLVPTIKDAVADRDRLEKVTEERRESEARLEQLQNDVEVGDAAAIDAATSAVGAEIATGQASLSEKKKALADVREKHELCGLVGEVSAWALPGNFCDEAEALNEAAEAAVETVQANLNNAEAEMAILNNPELGNSEKLDRLDAGGGQSIREREIENTHADLKQEQAEERTLQRSQDSWAGLIVNTWARAWKWMAGLAALFLLLPVLVRIVSYFLLMPLVTRLHKPIHLAAGSDAAETSLRTERAARTLTIELADGEVLTARSTHIRPVGGNRRSLLLYDWSSPFLSFASGLRELSRVTGDGAGTFARITAPDDPDAYLMRIDFEEHPGLVMHPKHVVGIIGAPQLRTRWRWGIQSFATWQVRYILFAGTGSLIVQGSGDVDALYPDEGRAGMDQNLVMGFDSRLAATVGRTEVFWQYLKGRTPLVLDEFSGEHPFFWQKSTAEGPSSPVAKVFDAFFSAFGKVLGF